MNIPFCKMQGLGNDFVVIETKDLVVVNLPELAQHICHRKFGIGADGMMVLKRQPLEMLFFNQDGSMAPMCGNGLRCFSKYVVDEGICENLEFEVLTGAGNLAVKVNTTSSQLKSVVSVNLGQASFQKECIPMNLNVPSPLLFQIEVSEKVYKLSALNLGTSHAVLFVDELELTFIEKLGAEIEKLSIFPKRINVNFCKVLTKDEISIVTWERGVGVTLACGTGAAACVAVGNELGKMNQRVQVNMRGGGLVVFIKNQDVWIEGDAVLVAKGHYHFE